jgi:hypothetical protein
MANVLLLGAQDAIDLVASRASSDHSLYSYSLEHLDDSSDTGLVPIGGAPAAPSGIDAILDLEWSGGASLMYDYLLNQKGTGSTILFTNTLVNTATALAAEFPDVPVIGISFVPALFVESTSIEAAPAMQTSREDLDRGVELLRGLTGKQVEVVEDRVALVSLRVLAMIINEAAFAVMEGVAGAGDIDVAMKLGTNYPEGPLRWADRIGAETVVAVLQALYDEYGEERYRPCVLLKQYARAGRSFYQPAVS